MRNPLGMWFARAFKDTFSGLIRTAILAVLGFGIAFVVYVERLGWSAAMAEFEIWWISVCGAIGAVAVLFLWNIACAPYRIERDAHEATQRELEQLRQRDQQLSKPSLTLSFDPKVHKLIAENGKRAWLRVGVKNDGMKSVRDVSVKIAEIYGETDEATKELQKYIGLPLCITIDPSDGYRVPREKPQHVMTLHQAETALFDVVQLHVLPGNHHLMHAMYQRSVHAMKIEQGGGPPIEQKPSGVIPPRKYTIVLSAVGDDVEPEKQKFEFSADENSVYFHKV